MMRVGLLGCGNIGHIVARYAGSFTISAVFDQAFERADEIASLSGATAYRDFESFINADLDIVLEAASVSAVKRYAPEVLAHRRNMVIMSVGALTDAGFRDTLRAMAKENGTKIYIPSGAIFGLDNLKIGRISTIKKLLLRTTKSPAALGIEATERRQIFSGKANECIKSYPKNVNVSVAMSLAAGMDSDVELFVDPAVNQNVHELFIEGDFGETYIRVTNKPSPDNPATSYLAALSVLSLLEKLEDPIVIGT
ncbi:aspartate dehydrogenase [Methanoregula sp.]|uniref:aspartate dehydrogenase n=1 Tax=Methanoregula sp. TaxID=2052170 RepID=UPI0023718974|nr:aspartate dehydrogenase [Methanoregula sp.]MDD1687751.1 aspartate dehydrogenase [Methanoregula sp.]